jgi:LuxR family maltose regulon positive regulatory protein
MSDYLLDQVFNDQPVEIQKFLLMAASFNQFCAAMFAEVLDSNQSEGDFQLMLERIEAAQLFLTPLDHQRSWYRYHHLFREMLLARQPYHLSPEQIEMYQRRAATWLIHQGQMDEALGYLVALQDWTGAAKIVESQFRALLNAEDFQGIQRRLGYFPEDFIATRPGLLLIQAWIAHFELRLVLMRSLTDKLQALLETTLQQNRAADRDTPLIGFEIIPHRVIQANIWVMEGAWYLLTNQGSQAVLVTRQAMDTLPENWLFARGNAMLYLGMSMNMEGQYHQAVELLLDQYHGLLDPSSTLGLRLLFCVASIHVFHGELELARQASERMLRDAHVSKLLLMQGWGYYGLWRVYLEWNQLEQAASYTQRAVDQRFTSNLHCSLESIASHVLLQHNLGDPEQAQQSLDLFQDLYREKSVPTPAMVTALNAWLKLKNGDREAARRWAESFTLPIAEQSIIWYHVPHLYKVKILMALREPETGQIVAQLLDEIEKLAERTHNNYMLVRVLVMRAVWLARQGENTATSETLARALRLARPGWFIHAFVEQGPEEMLALLLEAKHDLQQEAGLGEYIDKLIAAFPTSTDPSPPTSNLDEIKILLTDRQLEVLELLAERLSIKEIAARLHISPSTVQQHTHHIYRKLNVNNKRQAVLRATELGILSQKR